MIVLQPLQGTRKQIEDILDDAGRFLRAIHRTPRFLEKLLPSVIWGDPDRQKGPLYLTFDDGPDPTCTPLLLKTLDELEIDVSFFILGEKCLHNADIVEQLMESRHSVGYHGLNHQSWLFRLRSELDPVMNPETLEHLGGNNPFSRTKQEPLFLRPPYGRFDLAAISRAHLLGGKLVLWRLSTNDWLESSTPETLAVTLLQRARPGDIVLLHDGVPGSDHVVEALRLAVPILRRRGYNFATLDSLMNKENR